MDRVHSLGDSWCCIETPTGVNRGWQVYAGLLPEHRHGMPGSTAAQWAADDGGILSRALATMRPGDIVFVSLVGNDFLRAIADGTLTFPEIGAARSALARVVDTLVAAKLRVILMGYGHPRTDKFGSDIAVWGLCFLIRHVAQEAGTEYLPLADILVAEDHFAGTDIHPTEAGHRAIAAAVVAKARRSNVIAADWRR